MGNEQNGLEKLAPAALPTLGGTFRPPTGLAHVLQQLHSESGFGASVTAHRTLPAQAAETVPLPTWLHPELAAALKKSGVVSLYTHQAEAVAAVRAGHDVLLVTPTASGKTLCYNLPVLQRILEEPETRALYLFPTKALSQDQYHGLHRLISTLERPVSTFTFDGDTPSDARQAVRAHGHIVVSNPDMLHQGILPHHTKWLKLFRNLRYVVIDEVHQYRGVFGSHVSNVLRRLQRVCAFHGSAPQFVFCSATVANPAEHGEALLERPLHVVSKSGAPRGERHVVFCNPPVVNAQLGLRASYLQVARRLGTAFIGRGIATILFAQSRLHVELLLKYLREDLARMQLDPQRVQGYRGGYLPDLRRRIERGLREGQYLGVVATNALELGIDIGQLAVCILAGYPGTVASMWQRAGRAGRGHEPSLTLFVASSSPLDQYIVQNPDYFFAQSPEHARLHADNVFVAVDHIKCAAFELPFRDQEGFGRLPGSEVDAVLEHLAQHRVVHRSGGRTHWMSEVFPAAQVDLRAIPGENFAVIDLVHDRVLAEVDFESAQTTLHEHAIYNLDGVQYLVERLDYDNHQAFVRQVDNDYFTHALTYSRVQVLAVDDDRRGPGGAPVEHGEVSVTRQVVGFKKIKFYTGENIGFGDVNLPEITLHTTAYWFTLPEDRVRALGFGAEALVDGLAGLSFALQYVSAGLLMCDPRDLGRAVGDKSARWFAALQVERGAGEPSSALRGELDFAADRFDPTVFIYDNYPGGVGFSPTLFAHHEELLARTEQLVRGCPCSGGCPSCVGAQAGPAAQAKPIALALLACLRRADDGGAAC